MKKAQVAIIGFIMTIVLFVIVISLFYSQFTSLFMDKSEYPDIRGDSEHVSNLLLTEGYPTDWESETVKKIGLLDGDIISLRKLENFSRILYPQTKLLLGVKYDYMFFLERNDSSKIMVPNVHRDFLGWNGDVLSYPGNGGRPFEYFFDKISERAEHIARNEKFVKIDEGIQGISYGKLVVYTWSAIEDFVFNVTQCNNGINDDPGEDPEIDIDDPGCLDLDDINESNPFYNISCRVANSSCHANETEIIQFYGDSDEHHAALVGMGNTDRVCCWYVNYIDLTTDVGCGVSDGYDILVGLDKQENAHIQNSTYSSYSNRTCIRGPVKDIECQFDNSPSCPLETECLFSMDGSTNAHIGRCSYYDTNVCCQIII